MRLYYLGKPADGFGWGVCNTNLSAALAKLCDLVVCTDEKRKDYESPALIPIGNHQMEPVRRFRAPLRLGYTFFESPLPDNIRDKARWFDWIFCGSTWCESRLRLVGVEHCSTVIQGVDLERFTAQPWPERKGFRVFSGGKYEFRKAQDIVAVTMKYMLRDYSDAVLMNQWHNPWPATMHSMSRSTLIKNWKEPLAGLDLSRVISIPATPNEKMPSIYSEADIGFFPNRCEGGTNLPMMELMACGRPVIATVHTGHSDMLNAGVYPLTQGSFDAAGWWHNDVSDCLVQLEKAYKDREEVKRRGNLCRAHIEQFTWERCAKAILARVEQLHSSRQRS